VEVMGFIGPAVPVHLLDPDRPVLDRRCQRNTRVKKQNPMNVVFLYREQLVCLFFIITAQVYVSYNIQDAIAHRVTHICSFQL